MPHITAHFIILFFKKLDLRDTHTNFPNKNHYPKEKIPAMLMGNKTKQFYCFFQEKKKQEKEAYIQYITHSTSTYCCHYLHSK